jgi:hypothetical protein
MFGLIENLLLYAESGYVIWTAHWKGATLKLKKVQGEWNV